MIMRTFLTLLAVLVSGMTTLQAQSLEECRRLARDHYPEIREYDLIAATEQYNLSNAARAWLPQISLSGQATYQSATATYPDAFRNILKANGVDMSGIDKAQYRVAIDISQNIWDGGVSKANRELAEAEAAEQQSKLDVTLYGLQSRVDDIYFGILLLDERRVQTLSTIEVLQSNMNRITTYRDNGTAMQADVDAVEAELLTARQALTQIESARDCYRQMLEIFIGEPLKSDALERPAMPHNISHTHARPELAMFSSMEQKISAQQRAINTSVMPHFSLFAQGYYGYPGMDMFKSMTSTKWRLNAMVGVRMAWNIGAFYTKRNNTEKLQSAKQQIDIRRDVFLFNTELLTTREKGEIARLQKAIEDDARIVELRRSVRKAAESRFANGVIDTTDLLQKITDERNSELNRSTHEIELLQAIYRLKYTLNQ